MRQIFLILATAWSCLAACGSLAAQVIRLPAVEPGPAPTIGLDQPPDNRPRNLLTGYPSSLSQPLTLEGQPSAGPDLPGGVLGGAQPPAQMFVDPNGSLPPVAAPLPQPSSLPKGAKPGVFQQVLVAETYLPRAGGRNGFGMNDVLVQATFGFPFFNRENPLVVTPAFEVQMLDGPSAPALPPELYDASIFFLTIRKITERFDLHIGATPGVHGDYDKSNDDAIRVPGRLLGIWDWSPEAQVVFGVLYLARDDINFLPAGGVIWTPNDEAKYELIFPRPRIAHRFIYAGDIEWWWYVGGEFGGGSYAVRDAGGFGPNVVTLSDLRLLLGVERQVSGGINSRVEIGYVFNRKIEFQESLPTFEPQATFLLRGGLSY